YLIPLVGVAAFVWDGIFIGITQMRGRLQSSLIAAAVFFVSVAVLTRLMGNHGLWLSMLLYLFFRGLVQTIIFCNRVAR
ncbi:MAG: MATE family efflux transporter, partial [Prevotella sp.]|nr:MATE family efflux transporter [Prevotella sp.]